MGMKVLVAELVLRSVSGDVVLVLLRSLAIHISRIPFVAEGRDRIDSPVNEDAELRVLVPFGHFVFLQRFPVRAKRALMIRVIHFLEEGGALRVVLAAGLLPDLINLDRILRGRGSRGALGTEIGESGQHEYNSADPTQLIEENDPIASCPSLKREIEFAEYPCYRAPWLQRMRILR